MSSRFNPQRRQRLIDKFGIARIREQDWTGHPAIDADEESALLTRRLSPGASADPIIRRLCREDYDKPVTLADGELLFGAMDYLYSDMSRRRAAPWCAGGYSDSELIDRTECRFLDPERIDRFAEFLGWSAHGRPGQVEVVLHDKEAPVERGDQGQETCIAFPVLPSTEVDVPDDFTMDRPAVGEDTEPNYAWSVQRLVMRLMSLFATECRFCTTVSRLPRERGAYPDVALVVGRGQRVHVFPACQSCKFEIERPYYETEALDPRVLTFMGNDGFFEQIGHPEEKYY
ncbi:hypothetical protein BH683_017645 [Williamsia sp. 1138]|uniref:hypothetical protein n=1 Tax=Williamsia sp. 1138 TaxID=1903117 RepID=UPI000A0FBC12|nr:hypothetical protein [Williamsia sp. 1138]OZG27695.1 hypothetical protein BH683_017645 [Williamsia sp. 1138]